MKEGMIIMNNKHNPIKNFYSIKNNESISFDAEDALSLVFASCLNHDCEVSKCTSFNYFRDLKLRILYAEIKKIIRCMDEGDYDLSQLVDDHILRSAFAGSVFMKDGMGASYLIEAVIICKQLIAHQNVIIAGEIYRQVAERFHVSPEAVEKAIRYFTKELIPLGFPPINILTVSVYDVLSKTDREDCTKRLTKIVHFAEITVRMLEFCHNL